MIYNLIKIRSFDPLHYIATKGLMKPHTKVKSGDLSIMHHDKNVMPRPKLSSDKLKNHMTIQEFR